ncbi:DUF262 domain-containing protein [Paenibacillus polygoni]|uniref:DUF262 domain-containing protein n=1 Tax=Paenibacillus polygoni TaxID=3050112 RepID=A0ABY8X409_9BACL|nr:DUF262 domain-containing protein [Paenibacillus polygoni]WIV19197.1 DUF262 domain-containing protein [Paenibacillus polygoni]
MIETNKRLKDDLDKIVSSIQRKKSKPTGISFSIIADIFYANEKNMHENLISITDVVNYIEAAGLQVQMEDVEEENDDSNNSMTPFDPSKVDIAMNTLTFDLLIKRLENDEIDLFPDFQRKSGLWNSEQKSRLIESLLLRVPLPAFYFDGSNNSNWLIIDGLQRLSVIKEFFVDKSMRLTNLEFLRDLDGFGFDDLTRTHTRRIEETQIIAYVISPGTPENLKFNIFKRINTGGLKLEPQEIRHALYQGQATSFLKKLAESEEFKHATYGSIKTDRMLDREFVLRFCSFYLLGEEQYKGSIDDFLIEGMKRLNKLTSHELIDLELKFKKSMELAFKIFGMFAFRKQFDKSRRNPINKALFESWSVELAKLTDQQIKMAIDRGSKIDNAFMTKLSTSSSFEDSLNGSFEGYVRGRFRTIRYILEEVINDRES